MALISHSKNPQLNDLFEKHINNPQKLRKEPLEVRKEMASLLYETVQTRGWKEILYPIIARNGDPACLLHRTKEEYERLSLCVGKFYNLLQLINNALEFLKEKEEKEII